MVKHVPTYWLASLSLSSLLVKLFNTPAFYIIFFLTNLFLAFNLFPQLLRSRLFSISFSFAIFLFLNLYDYSILSCKFFISTLSFLLSFNILFICRQSLLSSNLLFRTLNILLILSLIIFSLTLIGLTDFGFSKAIYTFDNEINNQYTTRCIGLLCTKTFASFFPQAFIFSLFLVSYRLYTWIYVASLSYLDSTTALNRPFISFVKYSPLIFLPWVDSRIAVLFILLSYGYPLFLSLTQLLQFRFKHPLSSVYQLIIVLIIPFVFSSFVFMKALLYLPISFSERLPEFFPNIPFSLFGRGFSYSWHEISIRSEYLLPGLFIDIGFIGLLMALCIFLYILFLYLSSFRFQAFVLDELAYSKLIAFSFGFTLLLKSYSELRSPLLALSLVISLYIPSLATASSRCTPLR